MIKNKFAKWIEWLLDLLPLFAVLFSCLYVTFNNNAYESYSYVTTYVNVDDIQSGKSYMFNSSSLPYRSFDSGRTYFADVSNVKTNDTNLYNALISTNYTSFQVYSSASNKVLFLYDLSNASTTFSLVTNSLSFDFDLISYNSNNVNDLKLLIYNVSSNTLDNAFEYSLYKFNALGFDKLNFINWFTGLFLNGTSNVYTTFINGYLNYFLLVECTYVLPMVLYWFIHLGERLISKLEYGGDK